MSQSLLIKKELENIITKKMDQFLYVLEGSILVASKFKGKDLEKRIKLKFII